MLVLLRPHAAALGLDLAIAVGAAFLAGSAPGAPHRDPPPAAGHGGASRQEATRALPSAEKRRLTRSLRAALEAIPAPPRPHALEEESSSQEIVEHAPWDPAARRWLAPAAASAERVYVAPSATGDDDGPRAIEVRVELNGGWSLPEDLASEGGDPVVLPMPGALAVEVATIAPDPGGRLALPLTPEETENRLAVIRLYLGPERMERALRARAERAAAGGSAADSGAAGATEADAAGSEPAPAPRRPSDVRWITVRLHGPKLTIERHMQRIQVAELRGLLSR